MVKRFMTIGGIRTRFVRVTVYLTHQISVGLPRFVPK
jgi:hypothetical protein